MFVATLLTSPERPQLDPALVESLRQCLGWRGRGLVVT